MRKPAVALLCGLVAAAALVLAWRLAGEGAKTIPDSAPPPAAETGPPPALPASTQQAAAPARPAPAARPAASAASATSTSFALSSDHKALVQDATIAAADHKQLEQEPRDNDWATATEQRIRAELVRHEGSAGFDIIAIDCRSTLCAIQAFSYGEEGNRQWGKALADAFGQSLAGSFDSMNNASQTQGGRSAVLAFVHRRQTAPAAKP